MCFWHGIAEDVIWDARWQIERALGNGLSGHSSPNLFDQLPLRVRRAATCAMGSVDFFFYVVIQYLKECGNRSRRDRAADGSTLETMSLEKDYTETGKTYLRFRGAGAPVYGIFFWLRVKTQGIKFIAE